MLKRLQSEALLEKYYNEEIVDDETIHETQTKKSFKNKQQETLDKFDKAFNKKYKLIDDDEPKRQLEALLGTTQTVEFPAKNLALEIVSKNKRTINSVLPLIYVTTILTVFLPMIKAYFSKGQIFEDGIEAKVYYFSLVPLLIISLLNYYLFNT